LGQHVGFTVRERQLVEALIEFIKLGHKNPLKWAAEEVGIEYATAKNALYRVRNRYDKARHFIQDYRRYRQMMRGRRYL